MERVFLEFVLAVLQQQEEEQARHQRRWSLVVRPSSTHIALPTAHIAPSISFEPCSSSRKISKRAGATNVAGALWCVFL